MIPTLENITHLFLCGRCWNRLFIAIIESFVIPALENVSRALPDTPKALLEFVMFLELGLLELVCLGARVEL